jgi:hypothetical protein
MRFHSSLLTLALIALFALVAGPSYSSAQNRDSAKISRLLDQADYQAQQANNHADELQSYTYSGVCLQAQAAQLDLIRNDVNKLGKLLAQLHEIQNQGSPSQQDAINRFDPLLRQMAGQLTLTINYLNEHPDRVQMTTYKNYTHECADAASRASRVLSKIVSHDKAQAKAKTPAHSPELPDSGTSR